MKAKRATLRRTRKPPICGDRPRVDSNLRPPHSLDPAKSGASRLSSYRALAGEPGLQVFVLGNDYCAV
jgi:hypothetical protein